mgnify:CR=1 FL=1
MEIPNSLMAALAALFFVAVFVVAADAVAPVPALDPDDARCACHTFKSTGPGTSPECVPTYRCNFYNELTRHEEKALRTAGIKPYPRKRGGWRVPTRDAQEQTLLEGINTPDTTRDTSPTSDELDIIDAASVTDLEHLEAVLVAHNGAERAGASAPIAKAWQRIAGAKSRARKKGI